MPEIYDRFVIQAPFSDRRELIFKALELHFEIVRQRFTSARALIDGGFITHKTWAEPEDADVAIFVPPSEYVLVLADKALPLSTLQRVSAGSPTINTDKLHPMGGLMDAFFLPDVPPANLVWEKTWSSVKDHAGLLVPGRVKGYLEVIL